MSSIFYKLGGLKKYLDILSMRAEIVSSSNARRAEVRTIALKDFKAAAKDVDRKMAELVSALKDQQGCVDEEWEKINSKEAMLDRREKLLAESYPQFFLPDYAGVETFKMSIREPGSETACRIVSIAHSENANRKNSIMMNLDVDSLSIVFESSDGNAQAIDIPAALAPYLLWFLKEVGLDE